MPDLSFPGVPISAGALLETGHEHVTTKEASEGRGEGNTSLAMEPPRSAEKAVTDALRQAIREGVLAPGQRLAQADLAEQLGVSRIPLRDALRRLEAEALVQIDGRRGARVAELSVADIEEVYEIRIELEGRCVRLAVSNLSEGDAKRLVSLGEEMEAMATNPSEGLAARRDFYAALYEHAGRPRMRRVILQLRDNVARYHLLTNRELSRKAHSDLRDAILASDAKTAGRVLKNHLEEARDDLIGAVAQPDEVVAAS